VIIDVSDEYMEEAKRNILSQFSFNRSYDNNRESRWSERPGLNFHK
jgi:hypothetical protein